MQSSDELVHHLAKRLSGTDPNLGMLDLLASIVNENKDDLNYAALKTVLEQSLKNLLSESASDNAGASSQALQHNAIVNVVLKYDHLALSKPVLIDLAAMLQNCLVLGLFLQQQEHEDDGAGNMKFDQRTFKFLSKFGDHSLVTSIKEQRQNRASHLTHHQMSPAFDLKRAVSATLNFASLLLSRLATEGNVEFDQSCVQPIVVYAIAYCAAHNEEVARLSLRVVRQSLRLLAGSKWIQAQSLPSSEKERSCDSVDSACWYQIQSLLSEEQNEKRQSRRSDNAFYLWLTWIEYGRQSKDLQAALTNPQYWLWLQKGLRFGSTERRKTCLHILMASLTQVKGRYSSSIISWNEKDMAPIIVGWKKYVILAEMLFLDNSLIQIKAATDDLVYLMSQSEESGISASWITTLLALGFNSKASGISKFLCDVILDLPQAFLPWILDGIEAETVNIGSSFFMGTFIPFLVKSPHLVVRNSSPDYCQFGEDVATFVMKLLLSVTGASTLKETALVLLRFVSDTPGLSQTSGRLYLLKGIMSGLEGRRILSSEHTSIIAQISRLRFVSTMQRDLNGLYCIRLLQSLQEPKSFEEYGPHVYAMQSVLDECTHLLSLHEARHLSGTVTNSQFIEAHLIDLLKEDTEKHNARNVVSDHRRQIALLIAILVASERGISSQVQAVLSSAAHPSAVLSESVARAYFGIFQVLCRYDVRLTQTILQLSTVSELCLKIVHEFSSYPSLQQDSAQLAAIIRRLPLNGPNPIEKSHIVRQQCVNSWSIMEGTDFNNLEWPTKLEDSHTFNQLYANLAICNACVVALDGQIQFTSDDATTIASGILLLLNRCRPKLMKHMKIFQRILQELFSLLQGCLESIGAIPEQLSPGCLEAFRSSISTLDHDGLGEMLNCFLVVLDSCPSSLKDVPDLGGFLLELANAAEETKTAPGIDSPYLICIKVVLHPAIFNASVSIGPQLAKICKDIQKYTVHRRCLGPALSRALCNAFDHAADSFCREHELTEVLIEFLVPTNSATKDPDFILEVALARCLDDLIDQTSGSYEKYYGEPESFAELRIFDLLARFNFDDAIQDMFGKTIFDEIFEPWTKISNDDTFRVIHKWKRPEQLQAVLLLERFLDEDDCEDHFETLSVALSKEGSPTFRFLLEWLTCRCMLKFEHLQELIWGPLQDFENTPPAFVVSLMKIGHMVARNLEDSVTKEAYFNKLVLAAVPYATCSKMSVRHAGATLLPVLFEDAQGLGYTAITSNVLFQSLYTYTCSSPYRKAHCSAQMEMFDPVGNYSLVGILGGPYLGSDQGIEIRNIFTTADFTALGVDDLKRYVPIVTPKTSLPGPPRPQTPDVVKDEDIIMGGTPAPPSRQRSTPAPLQTKGGEWDMKKFLDRSDAVEGRLTNRRQAYDIIVIASLVDNPFNLGGISRVCELSGVHELHMADPDKSLKEKAFTSVSLSSELWLPVRQLKADDIAAFVELKRFQGYTIVGIEQTDRSVILGSVECKLPKKTVLLIGREHDGVPAKLLAEMDVCVEIKQFGETRSMNVQTATAVVLYDYVRQNSNL